MPARAAGPRVRLGKALWIEPETCRTVALTSAWSQPSFDGTHAEFQPKEPDKDSVTCHLSPPPFLIWSPSPFVRANNLLLGVQDNSLATNMMRF